MDISQSLTGLSLVALLSACGGGGGSPPTTTPPTTIQATILALESSGKLPTLDRSASIAGPDANNNGVCDDVDAYIAGQGYTAPQLKSVQQTAKALADILRVDTSNQNALRASDLSLQKSLNCVFSKFPDSSQSAAVIKNIEKINANTKARVEAYIKYQIAMNGKVLASPQGDTCE
ncbi:hypothetical protein [Rhodoferax antarcticus]|uniref:hypothetical protein n=1 Tax=Rhodoferax antarcticus TaxID=81479 RepID=UPI000AEE8DF3|nr:hypothetical protein [Rhodoferax antarcticus]